MRVHAGTMGRPFGRAGAEVGQFPAGLAEQLRGRVDPAMPGPVAYLHDAMALVRFPVEIGRELGQAAKARFACAQGPERIGLDRREPQDLAEGRAGKLAFVQEIVRAALDGLCAHVGTVFDREDDDQAIRSPDEAVKGVQALRIRHIQVREHEVERTRGETLERLAQRDHRFQVRLRGHGIEVHPDDLRRCRDVFEQEYAGRRTGPCEGK